MKKRKSLVGLRFFCLGAALDLFTFCYTLAVGVRECEQGHNAQSQA